MSKVLIDTNVLLDGFQIEEGITYVLLSSVNRELEKHKISNNEELKYKTRQAVRFIEDNLDRFYIDTKDYQVKFDKDCDSQYVDNKIVQACIENKYKLMTNDILLKQKARDYGIELVEHKTEVLDDYCGYKIVTPTLEQYASLQNNPENNIYDLLLNQYLIIKNEDGIEQSVFKWNGKTHVDLRKESYDLNTTYLGNFKCKDLYQRAAIDSLMHNDVTLIRGKAGSGKSLISLTYAIKCLTSKNSEINKIVIFINNVPVANSREQGFYKGTKLEKLKQTNVGSILISKLGGELIVDALIEKGLLVLLPFSDIRGYDTGDNSILWITEAQNLDIELMKLAVQRLGEGSKMIIDGDDKTQVDSFVYAGSRNGIRRLSKVFRGEKVYGEVEFTKIYRSKVAEIADKM